MIELENVTLREYVYFDREKVEDFLSTIEDGLREERTEIERKHGSKVKGSAGIPHIAKIEGEKGFSENELKILKTSTNASLFQRLYNYLDEQNMINHIGDSVNEEIWGKIKVGDLIEIDANIEFSALDSTIESITNLSTFIKQFNPKGMNKKAKEAITGFQMLNQQSSKEGFNIKITLPNNSKFKFVTTLPEKNTRVSKNELTGNYKVICRIQKILKRNEKFELFKLMPGLKMNRKTIKEFLKIFKDMPPIIGPAPKIEDLQISYPAMVITPIVIYR